MLQREDVLMPETKDKTLTRYLVIWSPFYEKGESRQGTIDVLHYAWRMKAPHLVERRGTELRESRDPEIIRKCSEWMEETWGKHLKHNIKSLSIIVISDPVWAETHGEERWKETIRMMTLGHTRASRQKRGKPQQFFFGVESDSL